ncbi:pyridoxamine 5'-phosphate oxidase family protein [Streptomyces boluensis]|uniref:Pyridoxamine 5'-phosphate oxidase n=1 Tax=Streptomyces boluensis TaxID=1775135 RepID=A0A964UX88_9ACTN|nr:pyridoxamine 5'-phosphate oxidase family protein [Streptomyces boluensis]NBE55970.1 pyridoxamine 5'-phosphate oxidase [Streptomyces boluensis]
MQPTDSSPDPSPLPRTTRTRRRETLERLVRERDVWVSTAHPEHGPHQVPLWFVWDGRALWMCTGARSATVRNIRAEPRVRLALPDSFDVVLVQGEAECFPDREVPAGAAEAFAAKFGWDPRAEDGPYVYLRVTPLTVRAWRGEPELRGRVVVRDGVWLDQDAPGSLTP